MSFDPFHKCLYNDNMKTLKEDIGWVPGMSNDPRVPGIQPPSTENMFDLSTMGQEKQLQAAVQFTPAELDQMMNRAYTALQNQDANTLWGKEGMGLIGVNQEELAQTISSCGALGEGTCQHIWNEAKKAVGNDITYPSYGIDAQEKSNLTKEQLVPYIERQMAQSLYGTVVKYLKNWSKPQPIPISRNNKVKNYIYPE